MTPHRSFFVEYTPHVIPILIANGHIIHSAGIGTVHFKPIVKGHPANVVILKNVLHVPELSQSLLSVMCLTVKHGYKVVIVRDCIYFYTKGSLVLTAKLFGNLAYLNGSTLHQPTSASALNTTASPLDITLWHRRFSHLNYTDLNAMVKKNLVTGLTLSSHASPDPICEPCLAGHQRRIVNRSATHQDTPLAVVHADLHGPLPTQSPEASDTGASLLMSVPDTGVSSFSNLRTRHFNPSNHTRHGLNFNQATKSRHCKMTKVVNSCLMNLSSS